MGQLITSAEARSRATIELAPVSVSVGYPETRKHGNTHTPQGVRNTETRKHKADTWHGNT
jgi:hypothetical protein